MYLYYFAPLFPAQALFSWFRPYNRAFEGLRGFGGSVGSFGSAIFVEQHVYPCGPVCTRNRRVYFLKFRMEQALSHNTTKPRVQAQQASSADRAALVLYHRPRSFAKRPELTGPGSPDLAVVILRPEVQ